MLSADVVRFGSVIWKKREEIQGWEEWEDKTRSGVKRVRQLREQEAQKSNRDFCNTQRQRRWKQRKYRIARRVVKQRDGESGGIWREKLKAKKIWEEQTNKGEMSDSVQSESRVMKCGYMDWTKEMKSEQMEEAGKREAGGVRDILQRAMSLTQSLERSIGLNHPPLPPLIVLFFASIFSLPLQTKQRKEKPWSSFFSTEPFTSVWGLDIKRKPVLQSYHLSNVLKLYNYIGCLTKAFIHRTQGDTADCL